MNNFLDFNSSHLEMFQFQFNLFIAHAGINFYPVSTVMHNCVTNADHACLFAISQEKSGVPLVAHEKFAKPKEVEVS
jgi:hypothetical protein